VTNLRNSHLKKQHSPIETILGEIIIEERLGHQIKQCFPIDVKEIRRNFLCIFENYKNNFGGEMK
jgi:hypothetical protein